MTGIPSNMYCIALGLALRECQPEAYLAVRAAIDDPGPDTVRAALKAGEGHRWRERIVHALVEIGIAASSQVACPK